MNNSEKLKAIIDELAQSQQKPRLNLGIDVRLEMRKELARHSLRSKAAFNRKYGQCWDVEAFRADYERVLGPL